MKNVDGQTDVGHLNLIGGLITRNPPKNYTRSLVVYFCLNKKITQTILQ